jgi:AraC-like DNA-binding protein
MFSRRRIDWSVILGPGAPVPAWTDNAAPSDVIALLLAFEDLFAIDDADALLRRAVALALDPVGLVRAGIYLYDQPLDLMLGTWGTDLERAVIDEHHAMFKNGDSGRRVFERALSGDAHWTVVEDCPIIVNEARATQVVGRGWVVCTPIRSGRGPLGMMYNDAGLTDAAVDPEAQMRVAMLCAVVGLRLEALRFSRRVPSVINLLARHPVIAKATQMLEKDPSLTGAAMARALDVSLSRLARVFKAETGLSLVDYRNQLRLERFGGIVDAGNTNLLSAALAAGFGSYAQFYRVFNAQRGETPRKYLEARRR